MKSAGRECPVCQTECVDDNIVRCLHSALKERFHDPYSYLLNPESAAPTIGENMIRNLQSYLDCFFFLADNGSVRSRDCLYECFYAFLSKYPSKILITSDLDKDGKSLLSEIVSAGARLRAMIDSHPDLIESARKTLTEVYEVSDKQNSAADFVSVVIASLGGGFPGKLPDRASNMNIIHVDDREEYERLYCRDCCKKIVTKEFAEFHTPRLEVISLKRDVKVNEHIISSNGIDCREFKLDKCPAWFNFGQNSPRAGKLTTRVLAMYSDEARDGENRQYLDGTTAMDFGRVGIILTPNDVMDGADILVSDRVNKKHSSFKLSGPSDLQRVSFFSKAYGLRGLYGDNSLL